jgi:hypothetical protein
MLSTKIRTTIITLVAAFSFAGPAIVPTLAQAKSMDCEGYRQDAFAYLRGGNQEVMRGDFVFAAREYGRASFALSEYSRWC